jgi:hypothetical protein
MGQARRKKAKNKETGIPNVFFTPPDLLQFESTEHLQFSTTLVSYPDEIRALQHIHGLYMAAMSNQTIEPNNIVIFQLLTFVHYHFLFASTCYMRCHMAEAFSSARTAIDAALITAQIIHDRPSQEAYINRTKPFDKLVRHFKNLIKDKKPLPSPLVEHLIRFYDNCSQFASHADVQTFMHRLHFVKDPSQQDVMSFGYFQIPRERLKKQAHFLDLLRIFVVTLDIFSAFIVEEIKSLPATWRDELHLLGQTIERRREGLI